MVIDYDGYMDFECTEGGVITGISATHDIRETTDATNSVALI